MEDVFGTTLRRVNNRTMFTSFIPQGKHRISSQEEFTNSGRADSIFRIDISALTVLPCENLSSDNIIALNQDLFCRVFSL